MSEGKIRAQSGLWEILPLKTATVPPYTTTNAILYGNNSFVLIDPGPTEDDEQKFLARHIEQRLNSKQKFLGVYLTHHHKDHVAAAEYLAQHFSVHIFAHRFAAKYSHIVMHHEVDNGDIIDLSDGITLAAIYTPGHSDDHMVFFDENNGVLLAGDMITDRGTVLIPPRGGSLRVYLNSLNAISRLKISIILPAHGEVIDKNPIEFLLKSMRHRYLRILAVLDVVSASTKPLQATDITMQIYHNVVPDNLLLFAQLSVESSLHWLKEMGIIHNPAHSWQVLNHTEEMKELTILGPLKEIDERLRNA